MQLQSNNIQEQQAVTVKHALVTISTKLVKHALVTISTKLQSNLL